MLEAAQLVDVEARELPEARLTLGAEGEAHDSVIVRVRAWETTRPTSSSSNHLPRIGRSHATAST